MQSKLFHSWKQLCINFFCGCFFFGLVSNTKNIPFQFYVCHRIIPFILPHNKKKHPPNINGLSQVFSLSLSANVAFSGVGGGRAATNATIRRLNGVNKCNFNCLEDFPALTEYFLVFLYVLTRVWVLLALPMCWFCCSPLWFSFSLNRFSPKTNRTDVMCHNNNKDPPNYSIVNETDVTVIWNVSVVCFLQ